MLSPNDLQATIAMVGETPDGSLAAVGTAIAAQYTLDAQFPGFGLEMLYVQRDLTRVAHGWAWQQIQVTSGDVRYSYEQRAVSLRGRLTQLEADIATRLAQARASCMVVSTGLMTTTAPVSPPYPAPYPDANSDLYRGSPYVSPPNPQGSQGTGW
jgi:hypothetical protein